MTRNRRFISLFMILCMLLPLICGCTAASVAWEHCPIGVQLAYGIRSDNLPAMTPIIEETTGGMFLDNRNDVFEEGVISVNNSSYQLPKALEQEIWDTMNEYKFVTGFYVIDLETRMSVGLNVDKEFSAASTVKTGYALYLAKALSEGLFSLDDILEYKEHHYCTGSGSTQYSEYGTLFTLKALFYRMIYNSDNVAYYMLSEYTGIDGYNELLASLGCHNSLTKKSRWCDFTPRELALIWSEIYDFKDTCEEGALLWKYLTTNLYNEFQVAMPEYSGSAHKSGWNHYGYHESGIVLAKRNYICVVMTETGFKNDCLHRTIRNLDRVMNDYDAWLKNRIQE